MTRKRWKPAQPQSMQHAIRLRQDELLDLQNRLNESVSLLTRFYRGEQNRLNESVSLLTRFYRG
jgi:hypothetical protein